MVFLVGAWGINLECHQFHKPFSISKNLLISVRHMFLTSEGGSYLGFWVELEFYPPPAVDGFHRIGHVVWSEYSVSSSIVSFGWMKFKARSTMNSIWWSWSIPVWERFCNGPYSLRWDFSFTYFCFSPFKCLFYGPFTWTTSWPSLLTIYTLDPWCVATIFLVSAYCLRDDLDQEICCLCLKV
jgi:hypothetical protein